MRQASPFLSALVVVCACWFPALPLAQVPTSLAVVPAREAAALERIETALAKKVSWDYAETPLRELLAAEAERAGIPIHLTKKIEDAGVERDAKVTLQVKGVSFESALCRMLGNVNLTILIKDEMLLVTTVEDAQSPENMVTRVYPVADLVKDADGNYDCDSLKDIISSSIEPDSWGDHSGPSPIDSFGGSPALVISQRRDIHQRIEALLIALRKVRTLQGVDPNAKPVIKGGAFPAVPLGIPANKLFESPPPPAVAPAQPSRAP